MVIFKSLQPDIDLPRDLTVWDWAFDSPYSPLNRFPESELRGYQNAITKERINWKDVKECTTYLSTALVKRYGLKEGETVALFSRNTIWYPVAMLGTLRAGGKVSGASPAYNVEEMTYALKTADAKFLMTAPTSMDIAVAAAKNAGIPKENVFLLEDQLEGYTTIKELIEMGKSYGASGQIPAFKLPPGKKNKDVCGFLSFSSGTTGLPKAVCLVHGLHLPILINAEVIMLPAFTMESMLSTIVEYQLGELLLVPPILIRLVRDPIVDKYDLRHLTRFSSGAAPLSEEIIQLLKKKFPGTGFKQGYGMTESCSCITAHPPDKYDYKYAHSVGSIVASTEVKIIREDGKEAGVGEPGEILARGPQIVMGYLNNEKATKETFDADGFLHTGDQGMIDEEGMVYILDRIKEMIKVKGIGVAPAELEDLLLGHDMVEDVAVLGMKDDYAGELPKAFVVLKAGVPESEKTAKELLAFVREKKTKYKWIKEIEFIKEIPKSASGKILRRLLRDKKSGADKVVVVRDAVGEKAML
ncbi:hypothetical protein H2199_000742 [Coniosporium tulheliwenetii]|uniref:Uncharacterized protein n=1 Tax=Coniosporium tulheliwenetii TaxID=3383036 RepID=A0ACC2ZMM2_9PEZI|nr:hypothetical protein H2199_000742 [Cladosporium sp. JES 115]